MGDMFHGTMSLVLNSSNFFYILQPHIGERMGLSITAVLAAVASELVVAANIPAASELTWFAKFSLISLLFSASALMESAAVIYFHYHTGDDLVPDWVRWIQSKRQSKTEAESSRKLLPQKDSPPLTDTSVQQSVSIAPGGEDGTADHKNAHDEAINITAKRSVSFENPVLFAGDSVVEVREAGEESTSSSEEPFLPPTNEEMAAVEEVVLGGRTRASVRTSRMDPSLMTSMRTRKTVKTILGRDADDFKNAKEMENNLKWQKFARVIDDISRVFFPLAFSIALASILSKAKM